MAVIVVAPIGLHIAAVHLDQVKLSLIRAFRMSGGVMIASTAAINAFSTNSSSAFPFILSAGIGTLSERTS